MGEFFGDIPVVGFSRPVLVTLTPWHAVREKMRRLIGDDAYEAWIVGLRFIAIENGCAVMGTSKSTVRSWVTKRYLARLQLAWIATYPEVTSVRIDVPLIEPVRRAKSIVPQVVVPGPVVIAPPPAPPQGHVNSIDDVELSPYMSRYQRIQCIVATDYGMEVSKMLSRTSIVDVAHPRQLAMYYASEHIPGATLKKTGRHFGDRDHSTVHNAKDRVRERIDKDGEFAARVERLRSIVLVAIKPDEIKEIPAAEAAE